MGPWVTISCLLQDTYHILQYRLLSKSRKLCVIDPRQYNNKSYLTALGIYENSQLREVDLVPHSYRGTITKSWWQNSPTEARPLRQLQQGSKKSRHCIVVFTAMQWFLLLDITMLSHLNHLNHWGILKQRVSWSCVTSFLTYRTRFFTKHIFPSSVTKC